MNEGDHFYSKSRFQLLNEFKDRVSKQLIRKGTEDSEKIIQFDKMRVRLSWCRSIEKLSLTICEENKKGKYSIYKPFTTDQEFYVLGRVKNQIVVWVNL